MVLQIDVISDVICPWCYIGKRRLEKAIAARDASTGASPLASLSTQSDNAERRDQPPGIPHQEVRKLGTVAGTRRQGDCGRQGQKASISHLTGLSGRQTPLDAHRLIWLADKQGVQDAVVEALFRAYFTEGHDINNRQALIDVVAQAGLDRDQAEAVLTRGEGMEAIKEAGELSQRHRVDGVPFFIVNGPITLSGAQQPDAFLMPSGRRLHREVDRRAWK